MGTRSGDMDPAVIFHLHRAAGLSVDKLDELLNHRSGLYGLAGMNDIRELEAARAGGNAAAALAFDVYCHRIMSYVGAYYALLGHLDAVTFTAGVGENSTEVRAMALAGLDRLGIAVDETRNAAHAPIISPDGTEVRICLIPTDEEHEIAAQTLASRLRLMSRGRSRATLSARYDQQLLVGEKVVGFGTEHVERLAQWEEHDVVAVGEPLTRLG